MTITTIQEGRIEGTESGTILNYSEARQSAEQEQRKSLLSFARYRRHEDHWSYLCSIDELRTTTSPLTQFCSVFACASRRDQQVMCARAACDVCVFITA